VSNRREMGEGEKGQTTGGGKKGKKGEKGGEEL